MNCRQETECRQSELGMQHWQVARKLAQAREWHIVESDEEVWRGSGSRHCALVTVTNYSP